jgi:hypothetical protein
MGSGGVSAARRQIEIAKPAVSLTPQPVVVYIGRKFAKEAVGESD